MEAKIIPFNGDRVRCLSQPCFAPHGVTNQNGIDWQILAAKAQAHTIWQAAHLQVAGVGWHQHIALGQKLRGSDNHNRLHA